MTYNEEPVALAKIVWNDPRSNEIQEYVLMEGATASIGRSQNNDICIPERHVSRRHCVIHFRDGIFMLSDLGSANGTFVNDQQLDEAFPLMGNDLIRLFVPEIKFLAGVTTEERENALSTGTLIMPKGVTNRPAVCITSGPEEGKDYPLLKDCVHVGRATANAAWEICLPDRAVSRPHACFERLSGSEAWQVKDLGSANGTQVNGNYIEANQSIVLADGDLLVFGGTMILFRYR